MTVLEQLQKAIEDGHPGDTEKLVREALKQHISSARIVEEAMTPAMRTVGENYKSNGADIIRILAAARSVRKGFELLEEQDTQFGRRNIGTVILGTVEGDLHDVGKNLVAVMFRSAGFKVIDLGVDISEKQFLRAVKQNPDVSIVCISKNQIIHFSLGNLCKVFLRNKIESNSHKYPHDQCCKRLWCHKCRRPWYDQKEQDHNRNNTSSQCHCRMNSVCIRSILFHFFSS